MEEGIGGKQECTDGWMREKEKGGLRGSRKEEGNYGGREGRSESPTLTP